jgi:hypothetical protein
MRFGEAIRTGNHNMSYSELDVSARCCGVLVSHTGCLLDCPMRPTELTLDVMETHGQHGSIAIRVQIRVQIEGETFSTETRGFQMPIVGHLLTAARDRPISPSD